MLILFCKRIFSDYLGLLRFSTSCSLLNTVLHLFCFRHSLDDITTISFFWGGMMNIAQSIYKSPSNRSSVVCLVFFLSFVFCIVFLKNIHIMILFQNTPSSTSSSTYFFFFFFFLSCRVIL